ncbi:hypothetical protein FHL15_011323 [Xylaria flabelliformis]|uniref:Carrier domain-containing protein n=1 Tax=Xylaria flabelliformis TaxID=2512241 RepID=A0A553HIK6_9PEZI|nr:hypothetical protein FHL15_011323 [Xylaria flabelliformis]
MIDFVSSGIVTVVADILFTEITNIDPVRSATYHGVDSLIAVELRNALGARINTAQLLDSKMSIAALTGRIVNAAIA